MFFKKSKTGKHQSDKTGIFKDDGEIMSENTSIAILKQNSEKSDIFDNIEVRNTKI